MPTKTKQSIALTFDRERETKNTVRYAEQADEGQAVVGTLYVSKSALEGIGNPAKLTVTIEG